MIHDVWLTHNCTIFSLLLQCHDKLLRTRKVWEHRHTGLKRSSMLLRLESVQQQCVHSEASRREVILPEIISDVKRLLRSNSSRFLKRDLKNPRVGLLDSNDA